MSNTLDRAVAAMVSGASVENWLRAEMLRSATERQRRLQRELRRSVKIEGQIFTVLEITESAAPGFAYRLSLRHWVNRRRAVIHVRADGTFGVLNWK